MSIYRTPVLMPWLGAFIDECASFPNAAHVYQVDSYEPGTQALDDMTTGQYQFFNGEPEERSDALGWAFGNLLAKPVNNSKTIEPRQHHHLRRSGLPSDARLLFRNSCSASA